VTTPPAAPPAPALWRDTVHFGTSTWTYPGWVGEVYTRKHQNAAEYLAEYVRDARFATVGIDSSFYAPLDHAVLSRYAAVLPHGFRCVCKAWEEVTAPRWPRHARYRDRAGLDNPHFLDAAWCEEHVLAPLRASFGDHVAAVVLEFQRMGLAQRDFAHRLDGFLGALPRDLPLAVEVRNRNFLTPRYFKVLAAHGVAHCFNQWADQMPLAEQVAIDQAWTAPFTVVRLLLPTGVPYAEAVRRFQPYDRIREPRPEVRAAAVALARRAMREGRTTWLLVNNRLEGSAPRTISALIEELETGAT
jgi:uncharacterized protein YecE (DUF72 family)